MRVSKNAVDLFVLTLVSSAWVASTVYLFLHPSTVAFATWAGMLATMGGIFHWLTQRDDKTKDAD